MLEENFLCTSNSNGFTGHYTVTKEEKAVTSSCLLSLLNMPRSLDSYETSKKCHSQFKPNKPEDRLINLLSNEEEEEEEDQNIKYKE